MAASFIFFCLAERSSKEFLPFGERRLVKKAVRNARFIREIDATRECRSPLLRYNSLSPLDDNKREWSDRPTDQKSKEYTVYYPFLYPPEAKMGPKGKICRLNQFFASRYECKPGLINFLVRSDLPLNTTSKTRACLVVLIHFHKLLSFCYCSNFE